MNELEQRAKKFALMYNSVDPKDVVISHTPQELYRMMALFAKKEMLNYQLTQDINKNK